MACSTTPKADDVDPIETPRADVEPGDVEDVVEAAATPTPPQPAVALGVLYEEENIEALNDWSFEFNDWESIGPFANLMPIAKVIEILGEPETVEDQSEWYGSQVDVYEYPTKGYTFHVSRDEDDYDGKVLSISARGPAIEATKLGIKVGSHAEEVEKVYGPYVNWRVSGESNLSIGFMYTWVQFLLVDGFVVEIHVGTGDPFDSFGDGED